MSHTLHPTEGGPREILLVDDEPADVLLAHEALKASGANLSMSVARSGAQALEMLKARAAPGGGAPPILVLLDLNMPVADGEATLTQIRRDPVVCLTPVVILTTSSNERDIDRAYGAGANGYIVKPLAFPALVQLFRDIDVFWMRYIVAPKAPPYKPPRWL